MVKILELIKNFGIFHVFQSKYFYFESNLEKQLKKINFFFRKNDDLVKEEPFKRPSTGASLRASSRGEIRSSMLQRSVRR